MWFLKAHNQWFIVTLLALVLSGCRPSSWSKDDSGTQASEAALRAFTIAAIKQESNVNAIFQLRGKVINRAPLLGKTVYEIQDPTGRIWVLTTEQSPKIGDEVVLKGKLLYRSIPLDGKEQGALYIEQQQELQRTSAVKRDRRASG